jgi:uncharacterized DUF497 family protein
LQLAPRYAAAYDHRVKIEYDPAKNERNITERGLPFDRAADFEFETAETIVEIRHGESRFVAVGYLYGRLHVLSYIDVEEGIRGISFRKANAREAKRYGKPKTIDG